MNKIYNKVLKVVEDLAEEALEGVGLIANQLDKAYRAAGHFINQNWNLWGWMVTVIVWISLFLMVTCL